MTRAAVAAVVLVAAVGAGDASSGVRGSAPALVQARTTVQRASASAASDLASATWCGTTSTADRVPNAVAGDPVHWVYVIPSDGPDRLASVASVMQTDAEQIDAWWRGQDPTRTPRNDLTAFPCGTQLDVTSVRASRSSAQLDSLSIRFLSLVDAVRQAGLTSPATKYLVYYDGPSTDQNVCGQGGGDTGGFGVAIVYFGSCGGVSSSVVAAHELLHTFGAVPQEAPHDCRGTSAGHTCDDPNDLMYPAAGGDPLTAKILDPGRDDYYGHSGGWVDTQDSPWLVRLDAQTPLTVTVFGTGSVSADVPGLLCTATCTTTWNTGQRLALRATPAPGTRLVRWAGPCSGSADCLLSVTAGKAVTAVFGPASFRLTVAVAGKGTVRSRGSEIACRPRCSAAFPLFAPVRLSATPAPGWRLRSWSGACAGVKRTCTVPMSAVTRAFARFVRA